LISDGLHLAVLLGTARQNAGVLLFARQYLRF
jgi:hypothetical protein